MSECLLSIITVVLNPSLSIFETFDSVNKLKSNEVEYIFIDGGSDPSILKQIEAYTTNFDIFLSENDSGIYDAMNKGWQLAKGKYLLFLNDGDVLLNIPFYDLKQNDSDVLLGAVLLDGNQSLKPSRGFALKIHNTWPHQGTFYARKLKHRYSLDYSVFSDFDMNQKLQALGVSTHLISTNNPISIHNTGGISHNKIHLAEFYSIIKKNQGLAYVLLSFLFFKLTGLLSKISKKL